MQRENINDLIDVFAYEKPGLLACKVFADPEFTDFKLLTKNSASDTQVMFASFLQQAKVNSKSDVAIKMWIDWDDPNLKPFRSGPNSALNTGKMDEKFENIDSYQGLNYEAMVYEFILNNIIRDKLSPNFIPLIALGICDLNSTQDDIIDAVKNPNSKSDLQEFFIDLPPMFQFKLKIIITGTNRDKMRSLDDLFRKEKLPNEEVASIIFQCLNALYLMEYFEIMHNDMHFGNILVQTLTTPICLTYKCGVNEVTFKTNYIVKFYDWDRGYVTALGNNGILLQDWSIATGASNGFKINHDYYQFMCGLTTSLKCFDVLSGILPERYQYSQTWKYGRQDIEVKVPANWEKNIKAIYGPLKQSNPELYNYIFPQEQNPNAEFVYYNIPVEDLPHFFTHDQINGYFLPQMKHSKTVFFRREKTNRTTLEVLGGWSCQALYDPANEYLFPLYLLFQEPDYFEQLTMYLDKCPNANPYETYVFPDYA